jgi:hypothetical protein
MSKSFLLILCIALFFSPDIKAQAPCAFDEKHDKLLSENPAFAQQIEQNNLTIRKLVEARKAMKPGAARPMAVVTIPVVVHVMHTGGAVGSIYNPSDAQIIGAINYLNQVYAGTYPGMAAPVEGGGIVDMEIQFALAQRTPSCGATNGINRVDASSLPNYVANGVNVDNADGTPELTLKNFSRWNTSDYYNIWIVNKLDGADGTVGQFIAGFAYFPGASSALDGTIMLATQMESGEKTLPHEIGHALSLHHPFRGSDDNTECPLNTDCSVNGDLVCDTDPVYNNYNSGTGVYSFSCRSSSSDNICTPIPYNKYSINTESNFMSYTNCFTLFTNDQKARAQAAMALSSRASLIDPGNLALIPCGTTVNFSQAAASRTEDITGTLSGCRRYRDYTYQMAIGAAPTATATATLTYSGSSVKGIDYDVTTNGNFANPDDVLTFNAGSTAAQTFTIRIYDDGDVETAETIVFDFTVNNGGGDASEGTTTPTFTLTLSDNDLAPVGASSGTYIIGVNSATINQTPFDARQQSQRAQFIYRADELTTAGINPGDITSFQLFIQSKLSTRPFSNFSIKMAHTDLNYLIDGSATVLNGLATVYSSASYSTIAGWNNFLLSTPFTWDGVNNLAIEICHDNTVADAGNGADVLRTFADGGSTGQRSTVFQNGISCSQSFSVLSSFQFGRKPMIQLGNNVTGTTIETVSGSIASIHINAGNSDYFYSNNNRLMMRISAAGASLGCVATSLDEAGTVWTNYQGGQRSAKVFAATPATNGETTNYTASFYFTNDELGGKNPATLRIAKTSASSAALANESNTVLITPLVTTLGTGTTVFTASFTGFSHFFLVDAGVILPVALTEFTVRLDNDDDAILRWITSSEYNNRGFDVEIGRDGTNFALLGTVVSQGNAGSEQFYHYVHAKPQPGVTYYRLKQTDIDGKHEYSKIISLDLNQTAVKPFVYPVPAKNKITLNFGSLITKARIEVFSADMKTVKCDNVNGPSVTKDIDISNLSKGVYFIRYSNGSTTELLRFIKE